MTNLRELQGLSLALVGAPPCSRQHIGSRPSRLCSRPLWPTFYPKLAGVCHSKKISGSPFLYHVIFGGGEPTGGWQRSITAAFACTTWRNVTFPNFLWRTAKHSRNLSAAWNPSPGIFMQIATKWKTLIRTSPNVSFSEHLLTSPPEAGAFDWICTVALIKFWGVRSIDTAAFKLKSVNFLLKSISPHRPLS